MKLPWAAPRSLRGQLLLWLLTLHVIAAGITACLAYVTYGRLVHNFMDEQMRLVAESYASHRKPPALQPLADAADLTRGAFVLQVWSADGGTLLASSWPTLAVPLQPAPGYVEMRTAAGDDGVWRIYTAPPPTTEGLPRVQVVQNDGFRRHRVIRRALFEGLPIALLLPLAMVLLWFIVSAASRSLRAVAREVVAQDERSLSELSAARVPDEIKPLVDAFNSLLGRLRAAFSTQRRFVQDAAHELRSPIAAIGLQIENLRPHVPSGEATERFRQLEAGVMRTRHLVEQLLSLSRQEAPLTSAGAGPVAVAALLREGLGQAMLLADQRGVDVGFEGCISPCVNAPAAELRSVFDNLIDNALRYTREGSAVDVRLHAVDGEAVVDVIDHGPGIPDALIGRAFDRFFRVPGSAAGGSGLGLAIAQAAAARNGLDIVLRNRSEEEGGPGLLARVHLRVNQPADLLTSA
ncbi:sensor histidine kinase [Variovorax sp. PAMC 28711]|uniref:sensor histidine kinase n=1 Tax=Variovorax sp. PAMC 28711 TaxID=1795631 RepID=UPI000B0D4617|nr:HAMP domain-containing sensor histidine kinase [Variovorax sp. PAMC 28711]